MTILLPHRASCCQTNQVCDSSSPSSRSTVPLVSSSSPSLPSSQPFSSFLSPYRFSAIIAHSRPLPPPRSPFPGLVPLRSRLSLTAISAPSLPPPAAGGAAGPPRLRSAGRAVPPSLHPSLYPSFPPSLYPSLHPSPLPPAARPPGRGCAGSAPLPRQPHRRRGGSEPCALGGGRAARSAHGSRALPPRGTGPLAD